MNRKKIVLILAIIIVAVLTGVGYMVTKNNSRAKDKTTPAPASTPTPPTPWKDTVLGQFQNLTGWTVTDNLADWKLVTLDRARLDKYAKGKILELRKSFNEAGEPKYEDQKTLELAVKKALTDNGWVFAAGPAAGSSYTDYLYVKDNHPLLIQIGTRDAVKGGMYVSIQFQY